MLIEKREGGKVYESLIFSVFSELEKKVLSALCRSLGVSVRRASTFQGAGRSCSMTQSIAYDPRAWIKKGAFLGPVLDPRVGVWNPNFIHFHIFFVKGGNWIKFCTLLRVETRKFCAHFRNGNWIKFFIHIFFQTNISVLISYFVVWFWATGKSFRVKIWQRET